MFGTKSETFNINF